jgi:DNA-binding SARP family transcriptional activator
MDNTTYRQQVVPCSDPACRRCRKGLGHGPYWYAYSTDEQGQTRRSSVGKKLPPEGQAASNPFPHESEQVRIFTLGRFEIERRVGQQWRRIPTTEWRTARARRLLALLLSSPARRAQREQVMDALWPDLDIASASDHLDRGAHELRRVLEPQRGAYAQGYLLTQEHEIIALASQNVIWVDADAFGDVMTQADAASQPGGKEHLLDEAVQIYRGGYLPSEQNLSVVLARRDHLNRQWVTAVLALAALRLRRNAANASIDVLHHLLAVDPTNEAAVQLLIVALAQQNRRIEALRLYQRFESDLARVHALSPSEETRHLVEDVREGRLPTLPARYGLQNNER